MPAVAIANDEIGKPVPAAATEVVGRGRRGGRGGGRSDPPPVKLLSEKLFECFPACGYG